ncbi:MAG: hypothetical protein GX493_07910 [Firmicutes bacterium]|nr:hypothetical protein [Bacillota bacterium]
MRKWSWLLAGLLWTGIASLGRAGENFLLEQEWWWKTGFSPEYVAVKPTEGPPVVWTVGGGRVVLYRWTSPLLETQGSFGGTVGRAVPLPESPGGRGYLVLLQDRQSYQIWREDGEEWRVAFGGGFGDRVTTLTAGRFAPGEEIGTFIQFETGRVGYGELGPEGLLPIWQSPLPWPRIEEVWAADFDGDGVEEVLLVRQDGSLAVARWQAGLWDVVWNFPSWGRILAVDLGQADALPGIEVVFTTAQRQVFLLGALPGGGWGVKARLSLPTVISYVALVPRSGGAILLGDTGGTLELWVMQSGGWRLEASLSTGERVAGLMGLADGRVLVLGASGQFRIIAVQSLAGVVVYLDGAEVGKGGLYWNEGEFYFGTELLRRALGILSRWDEKKATLTLTQGNLMISMTVGKAEVAIDGRRWPLRRGLVVSDKTVFVPAELLRTVFLINVTFDPVSQWLILTTPSPTG